MRSSHFWILAAGSAFLLSGCSQEFDRENQKNTSEIVSSRDELRMRLATAYEGAGDLGGAEKEYQDLAKSGNKQNVIELAAFYSRHNQPQRAAQLLAAAYAKSPKDTELMRALANALISAGNPEKALTMLDTALASHSDLPYIYNSRGVALDKLGRYSEAQQSYLKAISLSPPEEVDFKTNLSMSYILSGRYNDAVKLLSPLVAQNRATPAVRQNLALAYGLKGDMDKAMKAGSKDLSAKEMNENIRFYQLMAKTHPAHTSTTDTYPEIIIPPAPLSEEPPIVTGATVAPPPPPPPVADESTETIPAPLLIDSARTAPLPIAIPAEPVRNLSQAVPAHDTGTVVKMVKPIQNAAAPTSEIPVPVLKPDKW